MIGPHKAKCQQWTSQQQRHRRANTSGKGLGPLGFCAASFVKTSIECTVTNHIWHGAPLHPLRQTWRCDRACRLNSLRTARACRSIPVIYRSPCINRPHAPIRLLATVHVLYVAFRLLPSCGKCGLCAMLKDLDSDIDHRLDRTNG